MDMSAFLNILLSTENPVLPSPTAMRVALHVGWAIVLGSGLMLVVGKLSRPYQLGLSFLLMAWTLVPGIISPAYWLGLAFQTPSLTSALICLAWFLNRARREAGSEIRLTSPWTRSLPLLGAVGVVLGWVMLLDTLAWLPVSVYAWGFGSAALGGVVVFAALFWVFSGTTGANRWAPALIGPVLMLSVLTLFVVTRLPTGNVWDALIDPWLWVALQVGWIISAVRRLRAGKRPPATRA